MNRALIICIFIIHSFFLQAHGESVVCVHGFFRSYKNMIPLGNTLKDAGFEVYLWDYQSRKKNIEEHAEQLVDVVRQIAYRNPGKPIHFVGHSLGGIIIRSMINHPNCPKEAKIGKTVLLATPNKGASLARYFKNSLFAKCLFGDKAGKQLLTFDEEDVNKLGTFPPSMKVMVIAGNKKTKSFQKWIHAPNDGKVTVDETRLNSEHIHHTINVSHHWIMTSREVIAITKNFLLDLDMK